MRSGEFPKGINNAKTVTPDWIIILGAIYIPRIVWTGFVFTGEKIFKS